MRGSRDAACLLAEAYLAFQRIRKRRLAFYDLIIDHFCFVEVSYGLVCHASQALHPIALLELLLQLLKDLGSHVVLAATERSYRNLLVELPACKCADVCQDVLLLCQLTPAGTHTSQAIHFTKTVSILLYCVFTREVMCWSG